MSDPVEEYARGVLAGDYPAGRPVRLACERHLRDLETGHERGLVWDWAAGERVVQFFNFLEQRKGEWAGQPLKLLPWQVFRIGSVFGWKRDDGRRRFRVAWNEVPRGAGKTTEAAGIGNYLFRFDGEPGSEVYAAATKKEQASFCWDEAAWQIDHAPKALKRGIEVRVANMNHKATASKFQPIGADRDTADGLNPHGFVLDEMHAWKDEEFLGKLTTSMGKRRQPLRWVITTAGTKSSVVYLVEHDYAMGVLEGTIEDDTWFVYIATCDQPEKWDDPEQWRQANPGLGHNVHEEYLHTEAQMARLFPSKRNQFLRMYLNVITEQQDRWLDMDVWRDQAKRRDDLKGRRCHAALDLSIADDITALVLVFPDEDGNGVDILPFFWVPEEGVKMRSKRDRVPYDLWAEQGFIEPTPGDVVDYRVLRNRINQLAGDYQIETLSIDKWNAVQLMVELEDEDELPVEESRRGYALHPGLNEIERLLKLGELRHGHNPVLTWMAANVSVKEGQYEEWKVDKDKSGDRVDGIDALAMALVTWLESRKEGPSTYEENDLFVI